MHRCGKSYLLFRLYKKYLLSTGVQNEDIIEIPLDDDDFEELRERKNLSQYIKSRTDENRTFYVFLDEVQFCEGFESVLNGLSRKENLDIYVTGSNSKFLSSDILAEFKDRGDEVRVYPLSFAEYLSAYNGEKNDAWREFMLYEGLPRILSCKSDEQKAKYLQDLFKSVYLKDVVERNHLKGDTVLESIVDFLASAVGSLTNATRLSNTFVSNGIMTNDKTVSSYISYLEDAFLIEKAERYDVKGWKYINSAKKFYFTDVGLRNARLNFRQQEPSHILENIIYNELKIRGFSVDVGVVFSRALNQNKNSVRIPHEIDFIATKGGKKVYIQSAFALDSEEKIKSELKPFTLTADSFQKIIVRGDIKKRWFDESGILNIGIIDFLLDEKSMEF